MAGMIRIIATKVFCAALALAASLAAPIAAADEYPSKPIRVVVPFQAGGRVDLAMRIIGKHLQAQWGQPIVVDNRPGAGGNIGMDVVAKSAPDGYTLVSAANPMSANVTLYKKLPFDTLQAFAPITLYYIDSNVLAVAPSLGVNSVDDLIALAKSKPGHLTYASSGNGTSLHLSAELFKKMAGLDVLHVPYKGVPPLITDLMTGRVNMAFLGVSYSTPYINDGRLKGLAVTSTQRLEILRGLPTLDEAGLKGFEASSWAGLLAPAGTPDPIIRKVHKGVVAALNDQTTRAQLEKSGFELVGNTPEEFAAIIRTEIVKWGDIIRATGAKVD
jgi:tripartite-type tricarboxylate transporter receptor subunit TctC